MLDDVVSVPLWVDLTAVGVTSAQGALVAGQDPGRDRLDFIGVIFIGIAAGLGGGLIRDILLSRVPAALTTNSYLATAILAALVGMLFAAPVRRLAPVIVLVDAFALGLYLIVGMTTAAGAGLGTIPMIFIGVLASTGGGLVRDLLSGAPIALVQGGSFYVTAALGGALLFLAVKPFTNIGAASVCALTATLLLRVASLWFGWNSPRPQTLPVDLRFRKPG
ncbi:TRIC cation channel family protein [Phytomonospora sp. NPDC050363]|uniref:trimeric intracellular cation channel family protein n=1 Tax=Phytomonospora sp. NPDC050363 TaxID=3155642 RepID=UPI0033C2C623